MNYCLALVGLGVMKIGYQMYSHHKYQPEVERYPPVPPEIERADAVQKIQNVKSNWQNTASDEVKRFSSSKPQLFSKVRKEISTENESVFVSYLRAVELIEALRDTHYCFLHGQSHSAYLITRLITEDVERNDPSQKAKYRKFFRLPQDVENHAVNVSSFISENNPNTLDFFDEYYTNDLLSVSGYPLSTESGESAYHFFVHNGDHSYLEERVGKRILGEGWKKLNEISKKQGLGMLQVIAIPKDLVKNEETRGVYNSARWGHPTSKFINIKALEAQQRLEPIKGVEPQYRILTRTLNHPRVLTVTISDLSKEEKKRYYGLAKSLL